MFKWLAKKIRPYMEVPTRDWERRAALAQDVITSNLNLQEEVFALQDTVRSMAAYLGFTIEDGAARPSKEAAKELENAATIAKEAGEALLLRRKAEQLLKMFDIIAERRTLREHCAKMKQS